jgi:hypothetical protein
MAMPMPHDAHDRPTPEPVSGTRTPPQQRISPDEEAMQLLVKVVERARVAKSFAKLAGGLLTVTAAEASLHLRAAADAKVAEMMTLARAAKDAAVHVAQQRAQRPVDDAPETQDAPAQHAAE